MGSYSKGEVELLTNTKYMKRGPRCSKGETFVCRNVKKKKKGEIEQESGTEARVGKKGGQLVDKRRSAGAKRERIFSGVQGHWAA